MTEGIESYDAFFRAAFDNEPFDYQRRLATSEEMYSLVNVPTGAGKTAAILGAWLWHRYYYNPTSVGRRLVYCLPMRTLVEQTEQVARKAVKQLGAHGIVDKDRFEVHVLMGGDVSDTWDAYPERECILIGTQDMLLSRALNRGYAMSRFRWPVHFGLLNNDCLWVFDEIQLMGDGLATSTQLAAFRAQYKSFGTCYSIWMSATLDRGWLQTVDFTSHIELLTALELSAADRGAPALAQRLNAVKKIAPAPQECRTPEGLAAFVKASHTPGTQTLVVINRVTRARETFIALQKFYGLTPTRGRRQSATAAPEVNIPDLHLLHSRFRPHERQAWTQLLGAPPDERGRVIVATQVIEAGVDLSSQLLITDLAPYSSLVQRFGRCNRAGELSEARVFWVDVPLNDKDAKLATKNVLDVKEQARVALPYAWHELDAARALLVNMHSAAPAHLPGHHDPFVPAHVLRRRDLLDLFDTTPDLSGYDLDISRFVRGGDERDIMVAWRPLGANAPQDDTPRPARDELCPVSIGEFKTFIRGKDSAGIPRQAWVWNALDGVWETIRDEELRPGLTLLLDIKAGGYDQLRGWDESSRQVVEAVSGVAEDKDEAYNDDPLTYMNPLTYVKYAQTLTAHSREARMAAEYLVSALNDLQLDPWSTELICATHRHDLGKAHHIFQRTLQDLLPDTEPQTPWLAKSKRGGRHTRPHFRHELASALALLQMGASDLMVYLAACHHGKVRMSIRSLPGESKPGQPDARFARGIWDGDLLPAADLGDVVTPEIKLSLEPMLLGASENEARSWLERMLALCDHLGVFRLAYLESLIRAADVRASTYPQEVL